MGEVHCSGRRKAGHRRSLIAKLRTILCTRNTSCRFEINMKQRFVQIRVQFLKVFIWILYPKEFSFIASYSHKRSRFRRDRSEKIVVYAFWTLRGKRAFIPEMVVERIVRETFRECWETVIFKHCVPFFAGTCEDFSGDCCLRRKDCNWRVGRFWKEMLKKKRCFLWGVREMFEKRGRHTKGNIVVVSYKSRLLTV